MKKHQGHKAAVRRPYLTTTELLDISGISRKTLRGYESHGIIEPAYEENSYYKYWSLEQVDDLLTISDLTRNSELSLNEIAAKLEEEGEHFLNTVYEHTASNMRRTRRSLRRIAQTRRVAEDFGAIEQTSGYYLRYLPDRWQALIPLAPHCTQFADSSRYIDACRKLFNLIEIVGWSPSATFGTLISRNTHDEGGSRYLFVNLTAAPAPHPSGQHSIDCGCYHAFEAMPLCDQSRCFECARFGRNPTEDELARWQQETAKALEQGEDPQLRTVFTNELAEPYLTGCWSLYTRRHLGDESARCQAMEHGPSLRPRLMPQEVALPYGVTACHIPGGYFLCRQTSNARRDSVYAQMLKDIRALGTHEITRDEELEAFQLANNETDDKYVGQIEDSFQKEPFTSIADEDNQQLKGWNMPLREEDLSLLKLRSNTALQPEDGFLVISERTPLGRTAEEIVHELQIAVDVDDSLLGPGPDGHC